MHSPGTILAERYQLEELLGSSESGEVYRALDLADSSIVAVKILREGLAEDPDFVRRFRQEVAAISLLEHPSIVRVYGFQQDGHQAFLIMDYVPSESLRQRLMDAGGALPRAETARILDQLASALDYAHRHGVVHGDVKPGNILLSPGSRALLSDFGLVAAVQEAATTTKLAGSPAYMSPEQFEGREVDPRSDIYGLGVVLYEMATGRRPFSGENGVGVTARERLRDEHINHSPMDPHLLDSGIPAAAGMVVLRALAKVPGGRWANAHDMASAWWSAFAAAASGDRAAAESVAADAIGHGNPRREVVSDQSGAAVVNVPVRTTTNFSRPWALGGILLLGMAAIVVLFAWLVLNRGAGHGLAFAAGYARIPTSAMGTNAPTPDRTTGNSTEPTSTRTVTAQTGGGWLDSLTGRRPAWTPPALPSQPSAGATVTVAASTTQSPAGSLQAEVQTDANIRAGPGTDYGIIGGAASGTQLDITGRNAAGDWLQICCVSGDRMGWISASLAISNGAVTAVPVVNSEGSATASSPAVPPQTPTSALDTPTPRPTATPSPAATANTAMTPTPLAECPRPPEGAFANLPGGQAAAGCAVGVLSVTHFSHQYFEHGQMIYRNDVNSIYVLYDDRSWSAYRDTYIEGQPWQARRFVPPEGLRQPIKGFDRVWERPEVRDRLGWATHDEIGVIPGQVEDFQRGTALWLNSQGYLIRYFVLLADLSWKQF